MSTPQPRCSIKQVNNIGTVRSILALAWRAEPTPKEDVCARRRSSDIPSVVRGHVSESARRCIPTQQNRASGIRAVHNACRMIRAINFLCLKTNSHANTATSQVQANKIAQNISRTVGAATDVLVTSFCLPHEKGPPRHSI